MNTFLLPQPKTKISSNLLTNLVFLNLALIIFFAPFAFGTVHLWSETILELAILSALFLYILKSIKEGVIQYRKNILNILFSILISYITCQIYFGITRHPYYTYLALRLTLIYFALFFVVTNIMHDKKDIDNFMFKITLAGFFISALGIAQFITGTNKIYWVKEFPGRSFFSTFIYDNHFACYISMIAILTLGRLITNLYAGKAISWDLSLRQIFLNLLDNIFNKKALFTLFSFTIMVTALFLSKSRAGILVFLSSLIFFISSILFTRYPKKIIWIIASGLLATYLLLNWIGLGGVLNELNTIFSYKSYGGRLDEYIDALRMLKDYPLTGIGLGAFSNIFPMYRLGPVLNFYEYLHNDMLQFLIEVGIVGFTIALIPFSIFLIKLIKEVKNSAIKYKYYIGLSIISIFFYLALHTSIDFGLHNNAVASLFIIILAISLLIINLNLSSNDLEPNFKIRKLIVIKSKKNKIFLYIFSIIAFAYLSFIILKPFLAYILVEKKPSFSALAIAIKLDPKNDDLYFKNYQFIVNQLKKEKGIDESAVYDKAKIAIDKAIELNPYKTTYLIANGGLELWHKDYEGASSFFKEASLREPYNPLIQMVYSYALFWQGIHEKDMEEKERLLRKGLVYYSTATHLDRSLTLKSIITDEISYMLLRDILRKEGIEVR